MACVEPTNLDIRPPHVQVEEAIGAMLKHMEPGAQLPPEPTLAKQLGVSRATLREVLHIFAERGLLVRRQGVGTFVSSRIPILETGLEVLESLDRMAKRLGLATEVTHVHICERAPTPEEMTGLSIAKTTATPEVLVVDRVITVQGDAVADLRDVVPVTYLRQTDLDTAFNGSVLDILLQRDELMLSVSRTAIAAVQASAQCAARLDVPQGAALLELTAQLYSYDENVVDYSTSYFVPGYFRFQVMRKVVR